MIQIKIPLWETKEGSLSGSFSILSRQFVCFVNKNENKKGNQPDYSVTIQESNKNEVK